jgi:putative transcriptional regulator
MSIVLSELKMKGVKEMKPLFREIRLIKGFNQLEVSERMGIAQQLYSQYERGVALPRIDRAYKIAEILGCRVCDLYEVINDD